MSTRKMLCTLGRFDIPIIQLQPPFVVDLLDSNIALFGTSMSGKTTFLKTLIHILHKQYNEKQEQIFILDFGSALSEYRELPLVAAYFDNSNEEYVKRVFKIMDQILKHNIKELNGKNYRDSETNFIHTTLMIDNLNAFIDEARYTTYQEKLAKLCREGLSKGITIVVTATDTKGVGTYLGGFKQKIAYEMPQEKYQEIFTDKTGMIGNNPGHGFANVTVKPEGVTGTFRMNAPYEVQCALPYREEKSQGKADTKEMYRNKLDQKFGYSENRYLKCVTKYQTFPKELTREEYDRLRENAGITDRESQKAVSVGLDYVDFEPVQVDFRKSHVIAIYGKKEFGKTNLLKLLLNGIADRTSEVRVVFLDDGRNQLEKVYEELNVKTDAVLMNRYQEMEMELNDGTVCSKKLSPLQQFYFYLNQHYVNIDKRFMAGIYGLSRELSREYSKIPDCKANHPPFTIFVIQSKLVYLNSNENKFFMNAILPQMAAVAEEQGFCFVFSDVAKITDGEQNAFFNNVISDAFLLDNIAEFAGERGQKTIFGNMDVKTLKEDYARCELGDGYYYDVEADRLLKLKFIKLG
ncbi:MAG: cell division protein FtsK [Lachnospiraceae bacterium]|nr:cell division protein FtsK [Lachnospiraceae bacterium]